MCYIERVVRAGVSRAVSPNWILASGKRKLRREREESKIHVVNRKVRNAKCSPSNPVKRLSDLDKTGKPLLTAVTFGQLIFRV